MPLATIFNIMTLGAIAAAIGLIIDDAIVVVEQIHRTHEENPEEPSACISSKSDPLPISGYGRFFIEAPLSSLFLFY